MAFIKKKKSIQATGRVSRGVEGEKKKPSGKAFGKTTHIISTTRGGGKKGSLNVDEGDDTPRMPQSTKMSRLLKRYLKKVAILDLPPLKREGEKNSPINF